jgi:ABC-2 type transport system ATP-binding protein
LFHAVDNLTSPKPQLPLPRHQGPGQICFDFQIEFDYRLHHEAFMQENAIEIRGLRHSYDGRVIHQGLDLDVGRGRVVGLLGKNGVGKTTLINILMGFLRPSDGRCLVFGEPSHRLTPQTKSRVGLLFEGHLAYDFMTINEIERFYARFYPRWNPGRFRDLMGRLGLPGRHRIRHMSEGQRSQVVLGLLFAQEPDLLILDDYAMGLDAGYRRLFVDYLSDFAREQGRTVFLTSHVIEDMERLVDEVVLLRAGGEARRMELADFRDNFRCFTLPAHGRPAPAVGGVIHNVERAAGGRFELFSFAEAGAVAAALAASGFSPEGLCPQAMSLEDAFVGYTGRY